jgi:hypothetical protein
MGLAWWKAAHSRVVSANRDFLSRDKEVTDLVSDLEDTKRKLDELQAPVDADGYLTSKERSQLKGWERDFALAAVDTPAPSNADPLTMTQAQRDAIWSDDESAALNIKKLWEAVLLRSRKLPRNHQKPEGIASLASEVQNARDQWQSVHDLRVPPTATPADLAQQAQDALAAFNASRADLFGAFGSNYRLPGEGAGFEAQGPGTRFFGAYSSGAGAPPGSSGGTTVNLSVHHEEGPSDPYTWSRDVAFELAGAI